VSAGTDRHAVLVDRRRQSVLADGRRRLSVGSEEMLVLER